MKKILLNHFWILLTLLIFNNSYAQWTALNAVPENVSLNSISFLDDEHGWVCGSLGVILSFDRDSLKWDRVETNPGYNLSGISFIDPLTGFAVGNKGVILKSTNGGYDWTEIHYDSTFDFRNIFIVNTTIFTVGTKGKIFKSTDFGLTWIDLSFGTLNLNAVHFPDQQNGFIGTDSNYVLVTTNGGINWGQKLIFTSYGSHCNAIYFLDSLNGFAGGGSNMNQSGGYLAKTTNGGETWTGRNMEGRVKSMKFININQGIIVGGSGSYNRFLAYYNSGVITYRIDWFEGADIYSCEITESGKGWAVGMGANMLYADDFTQRWDQLFMGVDSNIKGIAVSPDNKFYITSSRNDYRDGVGVLMKTLGNTLMLRDFYSWQDFGGPPSGCRFFRAVAAPDTDHVIIKGDFVRRTTDGGITWLPGGGESAKKMFFINNSTGWSIEEGGSPWNISKTTDFGLTFTQQFNSTMEDIFMLNESLGYLAGNNYIGKTTDGGTNWITLLNPGVRIRFLYFFDENSGYAGGVSNTFLKTTDGGISWENVSFPFAGNDFHDIWFKGNIGFLAGSNGYVYKSTDYGVNWTAQKVAPSGTFGAIIMDNLNRVAAATGTQVYLSAHEEPVPVELISFTGYTNNNSVQLEWYTASELNNNGFSVERKSEYTRFEEVSFIKGNGTTSEKSFYSYSDFPSPGKYNYRLKQIDLDGSFTYSNVINVNASIPRNFEMQQNFPNPFNPSTIIKYSLPENLKVIIKVFDELGSEVEILVNEMKPAGTYEQIWDAGKLPSGVYFCRIQAGSFIETKKMLLLK